MPLPDVVSLLRVDQKLRRESTFESHQQLVAEADSRAAFVNRDWCKRLLR